MKYVAAVRAIEPDEAPEICGLPDKVQVALSGVAAVAREGLLALSVSTRMSRI